MNTTGDTKTSLRSTESCKVAVVQAAPVAFDLQRSLQKAQTLTREAAAKGAQLVLFPEAFLSAYPRGLDFGAVVGSRSDKGREDFFAIGRAAWMCPDLP
jgi:nitrilase